MLIIEMIGSGTFYDYYCCCCISVSLSMLVLVIKCDTHLSSLQDLLTLKKHCDTAPYRDD